jgi:hypothetical protein
VVVHLYCKILEVLHFLEFLLQLQVEYKLMAVVVVEAVTEIQLVQMGVVVVEEDHQLDLVV